MTEYSGDTSLWGDTSTFSGSRILCHHILGEVCTMAFNRVKNPERCVSAEKSWYRRSHTAWLESYRGSNRALLSTSTTLFDFTRSTSFFAFHPFTSPLHSPVPERSHSPHLLPIGKHTVWPNPTNNLLISCHFSFGSHASRANRVSSGLFVLCHPQRFVIR